MAAKALKAASARTTEILGPTGFGKFMVSAFIKQAVDDSVEDAVMTAMDELKSDFLPVVAKLGAKAVKSKKKKKVDPLAALKEGPKEYLSEEELAAAEGSDPIIVLSVGKHKTLTDVDTSVYTGYGCLAAMVHPTDSQLTTVTRRYRVLRQFSQDLATQDLSAPAPMAGEESEEQKEAPPAAAAAAANTDELSEFPPKKLFGNMSMGFIAERSAALDAYLNSVANAPGIGNSDFVLQHFGLMDDDTAEADAEVFSEAFTNTCEKFGISTDADPEDFEDEGTALTVLMLSVADDEILPPLMESSNAGNLPVIGGRFKKGLKQKVYQAVGAATNQVWEKSRTSFEGLKDKIRTFLDTKQAMLDETIKKVIDPVVAKIGAKIIEIQEKKAAARAAKGEEAAGEEAKEEQVEGNPQEAAQLLRLSIETSPTSREFWATLPNQAKASEAFGQMSKAINGAQKALIKRVVSEFKGRTASVTDKHLKATLGKALNAVTGSLELWQGTVEQSLKAAAPFFTQFDVITNELSAIAPEQITPVERKEKVSAAVAKLDTALANILRKSTKSVGKAVGKQIASLKKKLGGFDKRASKGLIKLAKSNPTDILNVLAMIRFRWNRALSSGQPEEEETQEAAAIRIRTLLAEVAAAPINDFLAAKWSTFRFALADAARLAFVSEFEELIAPVLEEVISEIGDLVPEELVNLGLDPAGMVNQAVDRMLYAVATKALAKSIAMVELAVFADGGDEDGEENAEEKED